ncbi:MAG: penicillin-insensitive murein endopeptidase [Paracoccus sp. (in: a-proteobacteria)]|nr:penicillin-insensitive murein endopeptidase [Paracoccus sp. (in: a-proteobacteria)]
MIQKTLLAAIAALSLGGADMAAANQLANQVFGNVPGPTAGTPAVIGGASRGCVSGAVALPETGPTWQAMRLSRNRNWAHPDTVNFLMGLSQAATQAGWRGLYIGDLSQPRGGPMTSGHASHQSGLDADIWMLPPSSLTLSRQQRENISSVSVVNQAGTGLSGNWNAGHAAIIRAAAQDPRVDRIFLDPVIKVEMCRMHGNQGDWLQKLRPLNGHDYHMHVRLRCPQGDRTCEPQTPGVAALSGNDNGCAEAAQWVQNRITPPPAPPPDPNYRHPRSFTMAEMPQQCQVVGTAR